MNEYMHIEKLTMSAKIIYIKKMEEINGNLFKRLFN